MSAGTSRRGARRVASAWNGRRAGQVAAAGASEWEMELRRLGVREADAIAEMDRHTEAGVALRQFVKARARMGYVPEAVLEALGMCKAIAADFNCGLLAEGSGLRVHGAMHGLGE